MAEGADRYLGRTAALGTRHGKDRALARPLRAGLGLSLLTPPDFDSDRFGTFSGETPRRLPPRETAVAKARAAMDATGLEIGIASEGSFGPHPALPFVAAGTELLAFVDAGIGLELVVERRSERTNFAHAPARSIDDLTEFLPRTRFPGHALLVRPNAGDGPIAKGLADEAALARAVEAAARASTDGLAFVETDMRAHLNPTRMREIRRLGVALARRLRSACPACGAPGWGRVGARAGLPCADCGTPTYAIAADVLGCAACGERREIRRGGRADPGSCPECNP